MNPMSRSEHTKLAYNRLIHSSLDMDRMDYLLRDSLGTGVPYGRIDLDYLLNNLDVVEEDGDVVVSHKAVTAAEHFLIARYFIHKAVYFHKTTFGLEAMLRHVLFLMRQAGHIYRDGKDIEALIETDEFLNFHDGYVDAQVQKFSSDKGDGPIIHLCKALKERKPPKLLHQVSVLQEASQKVDAEYALFTKDRVSRIKQMAITHGIPVEWWIWEDPKDIKFESMGPFVSLADAGDLEPEETAEMIRVRESDGTVRKLVEDQRSILHHLSKLRFRMSRLYLVGPVEETKFQAIQVQVKSWATL